MGGHVAQVLAGAFPSVDALATASVEDLGAVEGIGPEIAQSVSTSGSTTSTTCVCSTSCARPACGCEDEPVEAPPQGPLTGTTIVITGSLEAFSRDAAIRAAIDAGAHVTSSVSKKTDFVVVGESPGSKADRATQLGVETVDEEEFLRRLRS